MRIISRRTLREFWERHADAEQPLRAWYSEAKRASWESPAEVRSRCATASFVGSDRVIFKIGGNKYRLIVAIRYELGIVFIRFVGTHAEYDRVDARRV